MLMIMQETTDQQPTGQCSSSADQPCTAGASALLEDRVLYECRYTQSSAHAQILYSDTKSCVCITVIMIQMVTSQLMTWQCSKLVRIALILTEMQRRQDTQ